MSKKIFPHSNAALFHENNDSRSSILEKALFLTTGNGAGTMMIHDPPYQHSAYFHLQQSPQVRCLNQCVFPAVFSENRECTQRNGTYRMKHSGNVTVFTFPAGIHIAIAVIVIHTETEHEAIAAFITGSQPMIAQQICQSVTALLDGKNSIFLYLPYREQTIAWCNQRLRIHIHRSQRRLNFAGKEIIKTVDIIQLIVRQDDLILLRKWCNQKTRQGTIQKMAADL